MRWDDPNITEIISLALKEDRVDSDVTALCLIPEAMHSNASITVKEDCIFCGGPLIGRIITESKKNISVADLADEGQPVKKGTIVASLSGSTQALLSLERTFLNFLQRLSGVATYTHTFVQRAGITVLDTRKTMPGFRALDKYAVKIGGGANHRMNLSDRVLVKNNHIDAQQGDFQRIKELLHQHKPKDIQIEVEVRTIAELESLLASMIPDVIMLDNMKNEEIKGAIAIIRKISSETVIEISGGVTTERCKELAGLDPKLCVSIGALTTQARNVDISMKIF